MIMIIILVISNNMTTKSFDSYNTKEKSLKFCVFLSHINSLGDGIDSMSISTSSSSSLKRRVEEYVWLDNARDELISTECCRTIGISGTNALDE